MILVDIMDIALAGVALASFHDLAALDKGHFRKPADVKGQEVDRRRVELFVFHPFADRKAGTGRFPVFLLPGDLTGIFQLILRDLRVDLLFRDFRQILLDDLFRHVADRRPDLLFVSLVGDQEIAHAGEAAADGADPLFPEEFRGFRGTAHADDFGNDLAVHRMARADEIRLPVSLQEIAHILHAVNAVVRRDAVLIACAGDQLIIRRRVENDDRRFEGQQRVNGFQGRRIGQMLGNDDVHVLIVEFLRRAVKFLLHAADLVGKHHVDPLGLQHMDQCVHIVLERSSGRRILIVVKLDVKRQISCFDPVHFVLLPAGIRHFRPPGPLSMLSDRF